MMNKTKIYVCCTLSGERTGNVARCNQVAEKLRRLQMDVVTPFDDETPADPTSCQRVQLFAGLLFSCNAVVFLDDWNTHRDTRTAKFIAEQYGIQTYFEQDFVPEKSLLNRLQSAIVEVTGKESFEYCAENRRADNYIARLLFVHYAHENGVSVEMISKIVHKDESSVFRYLRKYRDEYQFNGKFRGLADKIGERLKI